MAGSVLSRWVFFGAQLAYWFAGAAHAQIRISSEAMAKACPHAAEWRAQQAVKEAKQESTKAQSGPTQPALRDELKRMADVDQAVRSHVPKDRDAAMKAMLAVDNPNIARLKAIIARYGFPTRAMVGEEGVFSAWLIAQHAGADPDLQRQVLKDITPLVQTGEIDAESYALMTDRVLVNHDRKPQLYGTQFDWVDGKVVPRPIGDAQHVDQRRAELGLMSLADYVCTSAVIYSQTHQ